MKSDSPICLARAIVPNKVGSMPSTEPGTQWAHVCSLADIYHVPTMCLAAGEPEGQAKTWVRSCKLMLRANNVQVMLGLVPG